VWKRLVEPFVFKTINLPRQARDKHIGRVEKTDLFSAGRSWEFSSSPVPNPLNRSANELQAAALPDGSIILNARDEKGPERLLARSASDGSSWSPLTPTPSLAGSICEGSTLSGTLENAFSAQISYY
jgi:hypothetical protein